MDAVEFAVFIIFSILLVVGVVVLYTHNEKTNRRLTDNNKAVGTHLKDLHNTKNDLKSRLGAGETEDATKVQDQNATHSIILPDGGTDGIKLNVPEGSGVKVCEPDGDCKTILVDSDLDDYYTKGETDTKINDAVSAFDTTISSRGYMTNTEAEARYQPKITTVSTFKEGMYVKPKPLTGNMSKFHKFESFKGGCEKRDRREGFQVFEKYANNAIDLIKTDKGDLNMTDNALDKTRQFLFKDDITGETPDPEFMEILDERIREVAGTITKGEKGDRGEKGEKGDRGKRGKNGKTPDVSKINEDIANARKLGKKALSMAKKNRKWTNDVLKHSNWSDRKLKSALEQKINATA